MKLFKSVLKQGLKAGAVEFKFTTGSPAQWKTDSGETKVLETEIPDESLMSKLLHEFFPQDQKSLAAGKAVRGRLAVINVGELMLLGIPGGPASIQVFVPPNGEALFNAAWERASKPEPIVAMKATDIFADPVENNQTKMSGTRESSLPPSIPIPVAVAPAPIEEEAAEEPAQGSGEPATPISAWNPGSEMSVLSTADARFQISTEDLHAPEDEEQNANDHFASAADETADNSVLWTPGGEQAEAFHIASDEGDEAPGEEDENASDGGFALVAQQTMEGVTAEPMMESPWVMPPPPPLPNIAAAPQVVYTPPAFPGAQPTAAAPGKIVFGPNLPGEVRQNRGPQPIDDVLHTMLQRKASDLHLSVGEPKALRIDGDVVRLDDKAITPQEMERLLLPIMTPRHVDDFAKEHDVDFAYEVAGLGRFRVNMYRDIHGVGAVFRMIPEVIPTFEQLKLPDTLRKFCDLEKGLVLVTGPTGSGKSTTLAAMIDNINRTRKEHILTIEDPVEFQHKAKQCLVHQREVHRHTQSFSRALRAALREDPDTVLIGEMRDLETISIALETAETGHLVFGTLHTNTAISTIDRIIDQFPANQQQQVRIMLAETLRGVVSQVLIKKRGGGRVAAHEILVVSKAVSSMIREGKTHMIHSHMQTKKSEGNVLLHESLTNLLNQGLIDAQEAYAKAADKDAMLVFLQKKGVATPFAA